MAQIWCNGTWQDALDFPALPTDRGVMHGLGLFETILAVDGRPVFAPLHIKRLLDSSARLGWSPLLPDLQRVMVALLETNELTTGRARIRLAITAGSGAVHDLTLGSDHLIWLTAMVAPDVPEFTTANLSPWVRNERSPLVGLKCASYAENLLALQHAAGLGFDETVFLNTVGNVCEAATSNVFIVKNGTILTPSLDSGCLAGITRQITINLSSQLNIPCEQRPLNVDELRGADEIFITSSIRGVMGLSRFEDRDFAPGIVTQIMRDAWSHEVERKSSAAVNV